MDMPNSPTSSTPRRSQRDTAAVAKTSSSPPSIRGSSSRELPLHRGQLYHIPLTHSGSDLSAGMFSSMVPESMAKCISKVFLTPAEQGCWCSLYAAASSDVTFEQNGVYFVPVGKTGKPSANGVDEALADKLWTWTEAQLALKGY